MRFWLVYSDAYESGEKAFATKAEARKGALNNWESSILLQCDVAGSGPALAAAIVNREFEKTQVEEFHGIKYGIDNPGKGDKR